MTPSAAPVGSLLVHRAFLRLWLARLFGTSASQMLMVAIGWEMYALTSSAWDLGMVGLLQFLPALLLVLVAGDVVDRVHRARLVAVCMAAQMLVAAVLTVEAWHGAGSRGLLFGLSIALGTIKAFQMPAQQALTPLLVPPALLPRALAMSSAGAQAAIVAGPALGGLIYVAGPGAVHATCTVLFMIAGALVAMVRYAQPPRRRQALGLDTLLGGVRFVRTRPVVLGAISLDLFAVLLGGATALLPMYARDVLHAGPWGLGLLRAAPAAGAFLMSVVLSRWPITRRAGHVLLGAVAVYGVATLVFGVSTSFGLSIAALAIAGAADMVSVVIRQSLVQLDTPDEMRGRVSAVNSVSSAARISWASSNRAPRPHGSVRSGRWCWAASARCWSRCSGCVSFPSWSGATHWSADAEGAREKARHAGLFVASSRGHGPGRCQVEEASFLTLCACLTLCAWVLCFLTIGAAGASGAGVAAGVCA